jgi:HK97 family phage prohead protease/HK97 family phage major capsid protein
MNPVPTTETLRHISVPVQFDTLMTRSASGKQKLSGHAAVYDSPSRGLPFVETIAPGAFDRALSAPGADVLLLVGHDHNAILARQSAGTLRLTSDAVGLRFDAELPNTTLANDWLELIRTGNVRGCSFAFASTRDEWSLREGVSHCRILEISQLPEISLVGEPAYLGTDVAARSVNGSRSRGVGVSHEPGPYGKGSPHSFFRDFSVVGLADKRREASVLDPRLRGNDPGDSYLGSMNWPSEDQARARLMAARQERTTQRALTTAIGSGGEPTGPGTMPAVLAAQYAIAARAKGVLMDALPVIPLEAGQPTGATSGIPRFTTGSTVGVQAVQGDAASSSTPGTAFASSPIATATGQVVISQQGLDLSNPHLADEAIAAELGAALAERIDIQILAGTGASGQTTGLLVWAGTTAKTVATATVAAIVSQLGSTFASTATAAGTPPELLLLSPRRAAWLVSQGALDFARPVIDGLLGRPIMTPAMPQTQGGGTEDALVVLTAEAVVIEANEPVLMVDSNSASGTLEVRFVVRRSFRVLARQPAGIGKLTGAGLAAPVFA